MIGQRLKLARSAAGLSLRALAAKIGNRVTAQAIGRYERNESMPGSGVLIALADALGVSVDYLVGDQDMVFEAVEFRKKTITRRREESQVEAKVLNLLERYLMVEELLHLRSVDWHIPREAPYPVVRDVAEADRAARSLRDHWGLGNDPIPNLVELLGRVHTFERFNDECEADEEGEHHIQLVEPRKDAAESLQSAKEPLHFIAFLILLSVVRPRFTAIALGRHDRSRS